MADGGIKTGIAQTIGEIGEAIVKPVTDEVGKAIESGAQSVVGSSKAQTLDPAVQERKRADEQERKERAIKVIEWNKNIQAAQAKVRQENQQKDIRKKQEVEQEQQKVRQFKVIEQQKTQQIMAVKQAQTRTEVKKGVGG